MRIEEDCVGYIDTGLDVVGLLLELALIGIIVGLLQVRGRSLINKEKQIQRTPRSKTRGMSRDGIDPRVGK